MEPRIHTGPVGPAPSDREICGSVTIGSVKEAITSSGADEATASVYGGTRVGSVTELMARRLPRFGE